MKRTNLLIISTILLVTLISVPSFVFASNIGRTIYGVFSETYAGVSADSSSEDYVHYYPANGAASNSTECIEGNVGIMIVEKSWYTEPFGDTSGKDMSVYSRIYFSVKFPSSGDTSKAYIKIQDTTARPIAFSNTNVKCVDATSTSGVLKDDAWHTYYIDLSNFASLDINHVKIPLVLSGDAGSGTFYVDNVIYAKAGAVYGNGSPVLDATLKNVNGNGTASPADKFTWNSNVFRTGWKCADQYVDLEVKYKDASQNNVDILSAESLNDLKKWSFRIYTSSKTETKEGGQYISTDQDGLIPYQKDGSNLVVYQNLDPNKKLSMCWRMMDTLLSTTSGSAHTTIIGEKSNYDLYDLGSSDSGKEGWNCWLYLRNFANYTAANKDYFTIWDYRGWHASTDPSNGFFSGWACTPKLYIGAKFTEALAGLEYRNKIIIESYYE